MSKHRVYIGIFGWMLSASIGACTCQKGKKSTAQDPLRNVNIAKDFTFATSRTVTVEIEVGPKWAKKGVRRVEIARVGRSLLFQSGIRGDKLKINLSVPSAESQLELRLIGPNNAEATARVTIVDHHARHIFP